MSADELNRVTLETNGDELVRRLVIVAQSQVAARLQNSEPESLEALMVSSWMSGFAAGSLTAWELPGIGPQLATSLVASANPDPERAGARASMGRLARAIAQYLSAAVSSDG